MKRFIVITLVLLVSLSAIFFPYFQQVFAELETIEITEYRIEGTAYFISRTCDKQYWVSSEERLNANSNGLYNEKELSFHTSFTQPDEDYFDTDGDGYITLSDGRTYRLNELKNARVMYDTDKQPEPLGNTKNAILSGGQIKITFDTSSPRKESTGGPSQCDNYLEHLYENLRVNVPWKLVAEVEKPEYTLEIDPTYRSVEVGKQGAYEAFLYKNGVRQDVTLHSKTTWNIQNSIIAEQVNTTNNRNVFRGSRRGDTNVVARFKDDSSNIDVSATARLNVYEDGDDSGGGDPGGGDPGNAGGGDNGIEAVCSAPSQVESGRQYEVDGSGSRSNGSITSYQWRAYNQNGLEMSMPAFEYTGVNSPVLKRILNNHTGSNGGFPITYRLDIQDSNGNSAWTECTVVITERVENAVIADIRPDPDFEIDPIEMTRAEYEADEEMTIGVWVTAMNSQITNSSYARLWYFADTVVSEIEGMEPRNADRELDHPGFRRFENATIENNRPIWDDSTVYVQFTYRPKSDPYIRGSLIAKASARNLWGYDDFEMRLPRQNPPDFQLVMRPTETWVFKHPDDGEHFYVYQDWDNKFRLERLNDEPGLVVETLNPDIISLEKMTDETGTSYFAQGLNEGQATIKATYEGKTVTSIINVYNMEMDINPKEKEFKVNDVATFNLTINSTHPDPSWSNRSVSRGDAEWEYSIEHIVQNGEVITDVDDIPLEDVIEVVGPGQIKGKMEAKIRVKAGYSGSRSFGLYHETETTMTVVPHEPIAAFIMPPSTYMHQPFTIDGSPSYSGNGSIENYEWVIHDPSDTLTGVRNDITFTTEGDYDITLTVTDNLGFQNSITKTISVKPNYPIATYQAEGDKKENRKVVLDASKSKGSLWGEFTIDHTLTEWEIVPTEGQSAAGIQIAPEMDQENIEVMFHSPGRYNVRVKVTNEKGDSSEWYEQILYISPDHPPVLSLIPNDPYYRNPENSNLATITVGSTSDSLDDDTIADRIWSYRFNPNQDSDFTGLPWTEITSARGNESASFDVTDVGKYQIQLVVIEGFGQPTIPGFYDDSLRKQSSTTVTVLVDNKFPQASFTDIGIRPKVQVVIMVSSDVTLTDAQIEQRIKQRLNNANIEVVIERIDE